MQENFHNAMKKCFHLADHAMKEAFKLDFRSQGEKVFERAKVHSPLLFLSVMECPKIYDTNYYAFADDVVHGTVQTVTLPIDAITISLATPTTILDTISNLLT